MNFRGTLYANRHIKRREQERAMQAHTSHLKNIRPVTSSLDVLELVSLNNKKKQMQIEAREKQIQNCNKMLLQKIINYKRQPVATSLHNYNREINRSLNKSYRRKYLQAIEIQNARILKRLQQKKPTYQTQKLNKQWKKQQYTLKVLSNFHQNFHQSRKLNKKNNQNSNNFNEDIEMCRVRVVDSTSFLVTVRLNHQKLQILADSKNKKGLKIIQVQRQQAIDFIQSQCYGDIEKIFDRLRYDNITEVLYLVGEDLDIRDNPQYTIKEEDQYCESSLIPELKNQQ